MVVQAVKSMIKTCTTVKPNNSKGFSLIELLVVMAIVAIVTASVTLINSSSSAKYINKQGDQLFAQMQFAMDEALMKNTAVGFLIEQDKDELTLSKRFRWQSDKGIDLETRDRHWENIKGYISKGALEEDLSWDITVEDASLEDSLDRLLLDDEAPPQPQIVFFPNGDVSQFEMILTLSEEALEGDPEAIDERYMITLNEYGELARYKVGVEAP